MRLPAFRTTQFDLSTVEHNALYCRWPLALAGQSSMSGHADEKTLEVRGGRLGQMAGTDPLRHEGQDGSAGRCQGNTCHVPVTGPSGVGKSFMAAALHRRGYATYDSDAIPGLAAWHDAGGHVMAWPDGLGQTSSVRTGSCGTPPD